MRKQLPEMFRITERTPIGVRGMVPISSEQDGANGAFLVPSSVGNHMLRVIVSDGMGWDHVSVSYPFRCPNWPEMEQIKRLFFEDAEAVFQLHPPISDYVNFHPFCLHMWRPHNATIPLPPSILVGPKPADKNPIRSS